MGTKSKMSSFYDLDLLVVLIYIKFDFDKLRVSLLVINNTYHLPNLKRATFGIVHPVK